mmetsp:Transcript_16131/g.47942  ORF Transcript_16131/g.47942 Transcript_16131/m.47942 type:complete len:129 (+) Transcript_16131:126-512(+)
MLTNMRRELHTTRNLAVNQPSKSCHSHPRHATRIPSCHVQAQQAMPGVYQRLPSHCPATVNLPTPPAHLLPPWHRTSRWLANSRGNANTLLICETPKAPQAHAQFSTAATPTTQWFCCATPYCALRPP